MPRAKFARGVPMESELIGTSGNEDAYFHIAVLPFEPIALLCGRQNHAVINQVMTPAFRNEGDERGSFHDRV